MGWSLLPNALRPFKINCAPSNLGITRTWICRLNFAQRPIFSGLRFFNEPEISDSRRPAWSPSRRTYAQDFYILKKNPSTSAGFEPANLGSRGELSGILRRIFYTYRRNGEEEGKKEGCWKNPEPCSLHLRFSVFPIKWKQTALAYINKHWRLLSIWSSWPCGARENACSVPNCAPGGSNGGVWWLLQQKDRKQAGHARGGEYRPQ